jgi:hypothetical protein
MAAALLRADDVGGVVDWALTNFAKVVPSAARGAYAIAPAPAQTYPRNDRLETVSVLIAAFLSTPI